jgi:hypothetical protein
VAALQQRNQSSGHRPPRRFARAADDAGAPHPARLELTVPEDFGRPPSERRSMEDRRRRHRERAIAAWLRDLSK